MDFDQNKYKVYTWKSWVGVLWILNPVFAIMELGFGLRVPKVVIIDSTMEGPRHERTIVPCLHCGKLHDFRTWSRPFGTDLKNWFGLYCSHCGKIIPCLMNLTTFIILVITYPFWIWFRKPLKASWLAAQLERYKSIYTQSAGKQSAKTWWLNGLIWGAFMFVAMVFLKPLIDGGAIS